RDPLVPPIVGRNRPRISHPPVIYESVRNIAVTKHNGRTAPNGRLPASHRPGQHKHRHHIGNGVHAPIVAISWSRSGAPLTDGVDRSAVVASWRPWLVSPEPDRSEAGCRPSPLASLTSPSNVSPDVSVSRNNPDARSCGSRHQ